MTPPAPTTQERLFDCALTLFAERGYEATSVREIIEAAGVTRPVLYYYCASKEDLFRRLIRSRHEGAYRELAGLLGEPGDCADRLRALARGSFAFCAADPRVPRLMFQTAYGPPLAGVADLVDELTALRFGLVCGVMQAGLEAGRLRGGDAGSLALVFCCLLDQHINVLARRPDAARLLTPALADALVDVFLHGAAGGERGAVSLPPLPAGREG